MRFSGACQTRAIGIVWREALEPLKNPDCLSSARVSSAAVLLLRETRFIGKESLSLLPRARSCIDRTQRSLAHSDRTGKLERTPSSRIQRDANPFGAWRTRRQSA